MLKKLRIRFILINMALVSLVLIGIFLANTISTAQKVASNSYFYLNEDRKRSDILAPEENAPRKDLPPQAFPHDIIWIRTGANKTEVLNLNDAPNYTDEYIDEIVNAAKETKDSRGLLKAYNLRFIVTPSHGQEIVIGFIDVSYEQAFIYDQLVNYVLIGLASLVVFFIISFFLSKFVVKPVDIAFKQQQQFISDASHELKTPITVILANTSIIQNNQDNKHTNKWVSYIEKEAKRMKKLVEDLLFLARLDENDSVVLHSKFNLSDALYECTLPFEPVAFEKGLSLDNDVENDMYTKGNIDQIKRLILILLDNACKYGKKGTAISVKLKSESGKVKLSVTNQGTPIPADEISKVFDRFYRVNKARERSSNSYGLGLSMAKKIAESNKGTISVISSKESGTTFTVMFNQA